jgi:hypothetical protein
MSFGSNINAAFDLLKCYNISSFIVLSHDRVTVEYDQVSPATPVRIQCRLPGMVHPMSTTV